MTPYQLLQVERERRWMSQRSKLVARRFYSGSVATISAELARVVSGIAYMTSYGMRRDWTIDALQRQRWALLNPTARFKLQTYREQAPHKPRFDDENEVLYLLSTPPMTSV